MTNNIMPVGQKLTAAREQLMLSVADVVSILKIKEPIISMIEKDNYPNQVIDIFTKGQLVAYCKLLKIDPQLILNSLEAKGYDFNQDQSREETPEANSSYKRYIIAPIALLVLFVGILLTPQTKEKKGPTFTQPIQQSRHYEQ